MQSLPQLGTDPVQAPPQRAEAILQTGSTEIRYRRAGRGSPVILLSREGVDAGLGAELFSWLAAGFRVIAPELPGMRSDPRPVMRSWLRDLIDGLGLASPGIVADESAGVGALEFALLHPERTRGLVTVHPDPIDPSDPPMRADARLVETGQRLLVLTTGTRGLAGCDFGALALAEEILRAG